MSKDRMAAYKVPANTETLPPLRDIPKEGDLSIDELMKTGLKAIRGVLDACLEESRKIEPSRASVQNLEAAMKMLAVLKEQEEDFTDSLSDEELAERAK